MGEQDVGDVGRRDAECGQVVEELPAPQPGGVERADAGIDEHDALAGADQEPAERDLEHPVLGEEARVGGPVLVLRALGVVGRAHGPERRCRREPGDAVDHRVDRDLPHLHRGHLTDCRLGPPLACGGVEAGATGFPDPGVEITQLFVVRDLDASVLFYTGVLGAELVRGVRRDLRRPGFRRHLGSPRDRRRADRRQADRHLRSARGPGPGQPGDHPPGGRLHGDLRGLAGARAEFLTPPVEYEREVRAFFRDPDGHLFEISEAR